MKFKLTKIFILFLYIFFCVFDTIRYVSAADSIQAVSFNINTKTTGDIFLNPGVDYYIEFNGKNNGDGNISDIQSFIRFEDVNSTNISNNFQYIEGALRTRIGSTTVNNPVPLSEFYLTGFQINVTNSGNNLVLPNSTISVSRSLANGIRTSQAIPYYSVILKGYFAGKGPGGVDLQSDTLNRNIFFNVKPHITDYYFEKEGSSTTTIVNDGVDSVDLVLKVKDYNGCTNIDGGNIYANLSTLGYVGNQNLVYESCDVDGKTATFRKSGVTTTAFIGEKTITPTSFSAYDEDGNQNNINDSNFNTDDKQTNLLISVLSAGAPDVSILSVSDYYLGGPEIQNTSIQFSGNQDGTYRISINSDNNCNGGLNMVDWTAYTGDDIISFQLGSASFQTGDNNVYVCIKNIYDEIGNASFVINKDITPPIITNFTLSPSSVITGDVNINFTCSENGFYSACIMSGSDCLDLISWTSAVSNVANSNVIDNNNLNFGQNTIVGKCKDRASNIASNTGTVEKNLPTPSMESKVYSFEDNDLDYYGIDGNDIKIVWDNNVGLDFSGFESWRIYVLPSNIELDTDIHNHLTAIGDPNINTWQGNSGITSDSQGNAFQTGLEYKGYLMMISSSGQYGTPGYAVLSGFSFDIITNANILAASFIADNLLEITTDTLLDTDLLSHSGSLLSYNIGSNLFNGLGVSSVSLSKINFLIPSIGNTYSTGNNLTLLTGSIHSQGGGYNNYFFSGTLKIADKIAPIITGLALNTIPSYGNFYSGTLDFSYNFSETMSGLNKTYIEFNRLSGNVDSNSYKTYLNLSNELSIGSNTKSIALSGLNLKCGTTYQYRIYGNDIPGNIGFTNYTGGIGFDNCPPSIPVINTLDVLGNGNFDLSWTASTDDNGNGSGLKNYNLNIYNGTGCVGLLTGFSTNSISNNFNNYSNGTYSWKVNSVDNMNNISAWSNCDDFVIDTTIPVIGTKSILDTSLNSSQYTKSGNQIIVSASINNTDTNNIYFDLSSLAGSQAYTGFRCSDASLDPNIDCSYNGQVTLTFNAGFAGSILDGSRQLIIKAYNTNGINLQSSSISISVDNTNPTIDGTFLISPTGGSYLGPNYNIVRTPSKIQDSNLNRIKIDYSTGAFTNWTNLMTGSNSGTYSWNLSNLIGGSYKLRFTAFDVVGNYTEYVMPSSFVVDIIPPLLGPNLLILPSDGDYIKGNNSYVFQWSSGSITDNNLDNSKVDIYYSTNNGTNYSLLISGVNNSGIYTGFIPGGLDSSIGKFKLTFWDLAGNSSTFTQSGNVVFDSTNPNLTITIAGSGGLTPPNNSYINSNSIDISGTATDANMNFTYYKLYDSTNNLHWNHSTNAWLGIENWNPICELSCNNFTNTIQPLINNNNNYILIFKTVDKAGNEAISSNFNYIGDIIPPTININNLSGSYFANSLLLSGVANDLLAGLSSVNIDIKKGALFWDGLGWVDSMQGLAISGTNTNWIYNFVPPIDDEDGLAYEFIVNAYDNSYKINNTYSTGISIIRDISPPFIDTNNFWVFPTGGILKGGTDYNIIWSSGALSDSGVGLGTTPISLEYFNGTSYEIIETELSNSGIYTWSIPYGIDINNTRIKLTVLDLLGNNDSILSNQFSIDSLPPEIQTINSLDMDADGKVDAFQVTMSESILDNTIVLSDFTIGSGIGVPISWESGQASNDNKFILKFNNFSDTSFVTTVDYNKGSITDIAGNLLETSTGNLTIDSAQPRIKTANALDINQNGKIDQIEIVFSENISNNTILSGFQLETLISGISINTLNISGTNIYLNLIEGVDFDTSTSGFFVSLNNSIYEDIAGNLIVNFDTFQVVDSAQPVLVSSRTYDTDINGKLDKIILTYSEDLTGNVLTGDFQFSGLSNGSYIVTGYLLSNSIEFDVFETSGIHDTNIEPTLTVNVITNISDSNNNYPIPVTDYTITDGIAPIILTRETMDSNGNGKIDKLKLIFSENLNDDFQGFALSISGYVIDSYSTDILLDSTIFVNLEEKNYFDGNSDLGGKVLSNNSLSDQNSNLIKVEQDNSLFIDKVGPTIAGARFDEAANAIYIAFTEPILDSSLSIGAFQLSGAGTTSIVSIDSLSVANDNYILLNLSNTQINIGNSKISINVDIIEDLSGNKQLIENFIDISASVVINEIMYSSLDSGIHQYLELRNLSSSTISLSGWIVENLGGNGVDFTLPDLTIQPDGYVLITKSNSNDSLLNVQPDYVFSSMNLGTGTNDLVLKNGLIINDTGRIAFDPLIGSSDSLVSMERKDNPGNGANPTNWYSAHATVGFDSQAYRGTPGTVNIFDSQPLNITNYYPNDNQLFQGGDIISRIYIDDGAGVGFDVNNFDYILSKRDGNSYLNITSSNILSGGVLSSNNLLEVKISNLDYGKYKLKFSIYDYAGNETQKIIYFYVDNFQIQIQNKQLNFDTIVSNSLYESLLDTTVIVKSLGAGYTLNYTKTSPLSGETFINDWDGNSGLGFDYSNNVYGNLIDFDSNYQQLSGSLVSTYTQNVNNDGLLNTNIHKIRLGIKLVNTTPSGIYNGNFFIEGFSVK